MSIWCSTELILSPVKYSLCTTEKLFHKELRRLGCPRNTWPKFTSNDWSGAAAHSFVSDSGKISVIVCIRPRSEHTGIQIASLLVHEAVHIWQEIRAVIGEKEPSSEFEAYSIQMISQNLMEQYANQCQQEATPVATSQE